MKNVKLFLFWGFSFISVLVIRIIQIIFLTDTKTGFWIDGNEVVGTVLSVFLFVITLLAALLGFLNNHDSFSSLPKRKVFLGITAVFAGAAQVFEPFITKITSNNIPQFMLQLHSITSVLSGIAFCWFGISLIAGFKAPYLLTVVPVINWLIRLVTTFICFTGMSNIADNLLDIAMIITILLFLFYQGKIFCSNGGKYKVPLMFAFGISSVLFTASAIIPRIFIEAIGVSEFSHVLVESPLSCGFTALYIAVYTVISANSRQNQ